MGIRDPVREWVRIGLDRTMGAREGLAIHSMMRADSEEEEEEDSLVDLSTDLAVEVVDTAVAAAQEAALIGAPAAAAVPSTPAPTRTTPPA